MENAIAASAVASCRQCDRVQFECALSDLTCDSLLGVCLCVCLFVWGAYCIECDLGQNMLRFFTFRNGKAEVNSVYTTAKYPVVSCDKIRQVIYAQLTLFGLLYL